MGRPRTPLAPPDRAREMLLMGLRLTEGIDLAWFEARTGRTLAQSVDADVLAQAEWRRAT